ncbi:MAG: rhodanese-like domain-containing protein [Gammaproteobacteria bacterium]|nr:rhodanese-like domain-containing protein [Gammaproteobacteria bacterium]
MTTPVLQHFTPREAWEFVQANPRALLIDIRSTAEYLFVGHPLGAIHIPWMDEPDWIVCPEFVPRVRRAVLGGIGSEAHAPSAPVLLICRSGKRSVDAGWALLHAGFSDVYNVLDGFEGDLDEHRHRGTLGGWRYEGLPWEQG